MSRPTLNDEHQRLLKKLALAELAGAFDSDPPEVQEVIERVMHSPEWPETMPSARRERLLQNILAKIRDSAKSQP